VRAAGKVGKTTVSEWIERWLDIQDVGVGTEYNREYMIRRFIRPAWGDTELSALSTEQITKLEKALPAKAGISLRTARAARTLLGTILGDAAATKPPLIQYNPALRPRGRGRRTGRHLERGPQRAWATPLQALLLAERAALLSGRDDDFTMLIRSATQACGSAKRSAWNATAPTPARSTSSGSSMRSTAGSTGSRPRTIPIAAPGTNPGSPSICHRS
jgi:hypothetical protein